MKGNKDKTEETFLFNEVFDREDMMKIHSKDRGEVNEFLLHDDE